MPTALTVETNGQQRHAPEAEPLPLSVNGLGFEAGGLRLLDSIDLELRQPGISVLLGPNGAGKSLFLRLCHGLLTPTSGRIAWGDLSPQQARGRQAMVFQKPVLLKRSVSANLDYALVLHGVRRQHRTERIAHALAMTGLAPLAGRAAQVLSGGEQQRLAIARALVLRPQVLLLDEPCAHLDPAATHAVEELVHKAKDEGIRILMTTHDLAQARRLADEVLFMHRGRLLDHAPADEFFSRPGSAAAAAYLRGELLHEPSNVFPLDSRQHSN